MVRRAALIAVLLSARLAGTREPKQPWLYDPVNMLVEENVDRAQEISGRAAKAGQDYSQVERLAEWCSLAHVRLA